MPWSRTVVALLALCAAYPGVLAADASVATGPLLISDAWVRAMPPGRKMTAAYMRLHNPGSQAVVIAGVSADEGDASIHETTTVDGQSRMRSISNLRIGAGESVVLRPGGRHIMLMGLSATPAVGDNFNLCILLDGGKQCLSAPVQRSADEARR